MSKNDLNLAAEIWKYIIERNPKLLHATDDDFISVVMGGIEKVAGKSRTYGLIAEDSFTKKRRFIQS